MKKFIWGAGALVALAAILVAAVTAAVTIAVQPAEAQAPRVVVRSPLSAASIGVSIRDVTGEDAVKAKMAQPAGVYVESVRDSGPAEKAGLQAGDIVVDFDGERVRSASHLSRVVQESVPNRPVSVVVIRGSSKQALTVVPEAGGTVNIISRGEVTRQLQDLQRNLQRDFQRDFNLNLDREALRRGLGVGGALGVTVSPLTDQLASYFGVKQGVLVSTVTENSPAASAGLRAGDVITAVNGQNVTSSADVTRAVRQASGESVEVSVMRDKKSLSLKATLPQARPRLPAGRSGRSGLPV
jgi:S1-C subfamily serine protease